MKKDKRIPVHKSNYPSDLSEEEKKSLDQFYSSLNNRLVLGWKEKDRLLADFGKAIEYYRRSGVMLEESLRRLDPMNLGGFYTRPPVAWFTLDDSSKAYPNTINQNQTPSFRLSATLKKPIVGEILQMALTFTIKRFPLFATTLKKGIFWHYLDSTKKRYPVHEEDDMPFRQMKLSLTGSQCFRTLYYKNRVSIEFFHVLTDGMGGIIFLKTLLAEYLRLLGTEVSRDETTFNINEPPELKEAHNEFSKAVKTQASGFKNKPALQLSGNLTKCRPNQIIHFKFDAAKLKEVSKNYSTTVTGYLLSLMMLASKAGIEEQRGDIGFQLPVTLRKFYESKTVGNFSLYANIRMPIGDIGTLPEVITEVSRQIKEKTTKEKMNEMMYSTHQIVNQIRFIPLVIKAPIVKIIMRILGEGTFTGTFSNLGIISLPPEMAGEVRDFDFILGPKGLNRSSCTMVTVNNAAVFTISKQTLDASFEDEMYRLLTNDGLEFIIEGSENYENNKYISVAEKA